MIINFDYKFLMGYFKLIQRPKIDLGIDILNCKTVISKIYQLFRPAEHLQLQITAFIAIVMQRFLLGTFSTKHVIC